MLLLDSSHVTTTLLFCFVFTICYYCRYKSVKFSDCECFLFFFHYFVGVGVNVSCVVSSCYILFVSVLAGGCCWFLLRTVKRINLCLFFVSSLTDWIRLFCVFFLCWWFYRIVLYFFFCCVCVFSSTLLSLLCFNVVVDNLYPLLFSFLWFSLILILVVYL